MIRARRFVYDPVADVVVEVGTAPCVPTFENIHDRTKDEYRGDRNDRSGAALVQVTLERAERREFAHNKYGDERRWKE